MINLTQDCCNDVQVYKAKVHSVKFDNNKLVDF